MRVFIGTDHAGLEFKEHLKKVLADNGHEPVDCGAFEYDAQDDYPPFCFEVGERTVAEPGTLGVVIGGSGNGEQIAANKVPGVRAALVWNTSTAQLARRPPSSFWSSCAPRSAATSGTPAGSAWSVTTSATGTVRRGACRPALRDHRDAPGGGQRASDDRLRAHLGAIEARAQNSSGHHGATGQPNAVEARVTAPGLTSRTRPAPRRVAIETPPR
jgi:hypothetical protein